jgi:low affinity Fe/Cu permease
MTKKKSDIFTRFTSRTGSFLGRPWAFILALLLVLAWLITGPLFQFSDTWQLVINTGTTVITFLMVFIIQNTQNRDNMAINIKLDALLEKHHITENDLIEAEEESDKDLEQQKKRLQEKNHTA